MRAERAGTLTAQETRPSRGAFLRFVPNPWRSPPARLVANRLLIAIPVLLGASLLTFFILDVLPGNAAQQLLGQDATREQVAQLEKQLHLDRPASQRYLAWGRGVLNRDLGKSLASNQPVVTMIAERIPVTLELLVLAFSLSLVLAVPAALLAAHAPNDILDRTIMFLSMAGLSMASYVLALVLVLVFSVRLMLLPSIGFVPIEDGLLRNLRSLALPAIATALPFACLYARFLRSDLLEQMSTEDYVATALAKGLSRGRVLVRHAFRNSLLGILTLVGLNFGALVGGSVIVEQIFALPGIGQLLLQAINTRDAPVVEALVLLLSAVTIAISLIVDLLYAVLDPRIRHECHQ
jgi:peptide/nickel transport system permease protein